MLDGEKCIRCRNYFKFEELKAGPEGFGICQKCAAKINPAKQIPRACPNDGGEMKKEVIYNLVLIDKCPSCAGVWLDGESLEIIKREIKAEAGGGFASGFLLGVIVG